MELVGGGSVINGSTPSSFIGYGNVKIGLSKRADFTRGLIMPMEGLLPTGLTREVQERPV